MNRTDRREGRREQELRLELELKYAKAVCLANFDVWGISKQMQAGGRYDASEEASARAALYRSLAEYETLQLQREKQRNDR